MKVYIKDRETFSTKAALDCYSYTLVKSIYTDLSELVTEYSDQAELGDILIDNMGYLGVISNLEREDKGSLAIKCQDISTLFSRSIIYQGDADNINAENYLEQYLYEQYGGDQSDPFYQLAYISVDRQTSTTPCIPDTEDGLWNCKSYISRIRRLYGIYTDFEANNLDGRPVLKVTIARKQLDPKRVFTTNRNVDITEETFSNTTIAKITAYTRGDTPTANDYYMTNSGTYTTNPNDPNRIAGDWEYLEIQEGESETEQVLNKFKENTYSHKISFIVPENEARYDFYDPVVVELRSQYYDSYIAKKIKHDNGTIEYVCGELRTSLTDKINKTL